MKIMSQMTELLEKLEKSGLIERLDETEKKMAVNHADTIINLVRDWPDTDTYNTLGAVYPLLNKRQRYGGLRIVLNVMDRIRYDHVSASHTPYIRDPQLLSDISASQPLYWPGLHDEESLWKGKNFDQLREEIMGADGLFVPDRVTSDFVVAYALLRSDFTNFGEEYAKAANPEFLKRVLKGIITLRFAKDKNGDEKEKDRKRLRELLPKSLHEQIEPLKQEEDWMLVA